MQNRFVKKLNRLEIVLITSFYYTTINNILRFFKTSNITETNNLIVASPAWVSRKLGLKKAKRDGKAKSEPWWKCRIKDYITELNRNINLLTRHENGEVKSKRKVENLESCKKAWGQY